MITITIHNLDIVDPNALYADTASGNEPGAYWKVTIIFLSGRTKVMKNVDVKPTPDPDGNVSIMGTNVDSTEVISFEFNMSNVESMEWQLYSKG